MTIGIGTYSPAPKYWFPRSYIYEVFNCDAGFSLTQDVNKFALSFAPVFPSVYHWTFDLDWWLWNSNVRSIDHIITECYYVDTPSTVQTPLNFTLHWGRFAPSFRAALKFAPNGNFTNPVAAILPTYPPHYWARPT